MKRVAHQIVRPSGILRQRGDTAPVRLHVLDVALNSELGGQVLRTKVQRGELGAVRGKAGDDVQAGVNGLPGFEDQAVVLLQ